MASLAHGRDKKYYVLLSDLIVACARYFDIVFYAMYGINVDIDVPM